MSINENHPFQSIRNRSNHHIINYNPLITRRHPGRNIPRITHKDSYKRSTMRNYSTHCLRNPILLIIFVSTLPYKIITNNCTRIILTTYSNSTTQSHTSPCTKHSNPTCLRSNSHMSTSQPTRQQCHTSNARAILHDTVRNLFYCYWSEFLATDTEVSGSIPGATRFSE